MLSGVAPAEVGSEEETTSILALQSMVTILDLTHRALKAIKPEDDMVQTWTLECLLNKVLF